MKLKGGYTGFTLSLRPSVHLWTESCLLCMYPQQFLLDPFHIYTSYQATSKGVWHVKLFAKFQNVNFWQIFEICNFDFVLFWLGIQYESKVWIIKGRRRVFSECRRSSCSCWYSQYKSIWPFWSNMNVDFSISIYQISSLWAIMS